MNSKTPCKQIAFNVKSKRGFSPKFSRNGARSASLSHKSKPVMPTLDYHSNSGKKILQNDPMSLSFDANEEILKSYQCHIRKLEETQNKLLLRLNKLESLHEDLQTPGVLKLQKENKTLRDALQEAQSVVYEEKKLSTTLHQDNSRLKLELLQTSQQLIALQLISGVSESRIATLKESDQVRQKLPEKLKKLQQRLWRRADEQTIKGKVSPEEVLCLKDRIQCLEETLAENEETWKEEKEALLQDKELCLQELEMDFSKLKEWIIESQRKMTDCQKECHNSVAHCAKLTQELQQEGTRHLQERERLLSAMVKIGGAERLRKELQDLELSSSCLTAAEGHASSTCQARELKLLAMSLQRELSECKELLKQSEGKLNSMQREKELLRTGRQEAMDSIRKLRSKSSEDKSNLQNQFDKLERRYKTELQGINADINKQENDLKKLVSMMYKLIVWMGDQCPPGGCPPSPPDWVTKPRAIATLARKLQAAQDEIKGRAGVLRRRNEL